MKSKCPPPQMEVERLRGVVSKSLEFRGEIFILERVGRWLEGVMLEKCRKIKLVLEQVCWCLGAFVHAAPHSASAPLAAPVTGFISVRRRPPGFLMPPLSARSFLYVFYCAYHLLKRSCLFLIFKVSVPSHERWGGPRAGTVPPLEQALLKH